MSPPILGQNTPSVGRVVRYHLTEQDKASGRYLTEPDQAPDSVPAIITRCYYDQGTGTWGVNLFVIRDLGQPFGLEMVPAGTEPGCWSWPPLAPQAPAASPSPLVRRAAN